MARLSFSVVEGGESKVTTIALRRPATGQQSRISAEIAEKAKPRAKRFDLQLV